MKWTDEASLDVGHDLHNLLVGHALGPGHILLYNLLGVGLVAHGPGPGASSGLIDDHNEMVLSSHAPHERAGDVELHPLQRVLSSMFQLHCMREGPRFGVSPHA